MKILQITKKEYEHLNKILVETGEPFLPGDPPATVVNTEGDANYYYVIFETQTEIISYENEKENFIPIIAN